MLSEETTEKLVNILVERIEELNTFILKQIGNNIDEINTLKNGDAQQLAQMLKYGANYDKIRKKLKEITKLNLKDIDKIFKAVAKNDLNFAKDFYNYRNIKYIPYEENFALKNQVEALGRITKQTYSNFSRANAIGYSVKDKKNNIIFQSLETVYRDAIDKAVLSVSRGASTPKQEIQNFLKQIAQSGLKTIDYQSGRSVRLDSAMEMYMHGAISELHNETQMEIGKQFKSDGVEISVHNFPAPDHEDVQGRQFRTEEYEKLQKGLDAKDVNNITYNLDHDDKNGYRPISTMNCYHYIFAIVVEVSRPNYSDAELKEIIENNKKGVNIDGKQYTMYEATQMQRSLERKIREQKDLQILGKATKDDDLIQESQKNINKLTQKYNRFSKLSGLSTKAERLRVSGYRPIKVK